MTKRASLFDSVIPCQWEQTQDGWHLWVKGRKSISGYGATIAEAERELIDAIMMAAPDLDAIDPVLPEYEPPLPLSSFARPYLTPELFIVRGDSFCELLKPREDLKESPESRAELLESLYSGEICSTCHCYAGQRTSVVMRVDTGLEGSDAGWVRAPFHNHVSIYSERLLKLMSSSGLHGFEFQEIEILAKNRIKYYELRSEPIVSVVSVRGLDADGIECPDCGIRRLETYDPRLDEGGLSLRQFICSEDLPVPVPDCFVVDSSSGNHLCMTAQAWNQFRDQSSLRGVSADRLGVVQADQCDRHPRIRNQFYPCALCAEWCRPLTIDGRIQGRFDLPATMCSRRSATWLNEAEKLGYIVVVRATMDPMEIFLLSKEKQSPKRTEFFIFRCPQCWRLGKFVLSAADGELGLDWT